MAGRHELVETKWLDSGCAEIYVFCPAAGRSYEIYCCDAECGRIVRRGCGKRLALRVRVEIVEND